MDSHRIALPVGEHRAGQLDGLAPLAFGGGELPRARQVDGAPLVSPAGHHGDDGHQYNRNNSSHFFFAMLMVTSFLTTFLQLKKSASWSATIFTSVSVILLMGFSGSPLKNIARRAP